MALFSNLSLYLLPEMVGAVILRYTGSRLSKHRIVTMQYVNASRCSQTALGLKRQQLNSVKK